MIKITIAGVETEFKSFRALAEFAKILEMGSIGKSMEAKTVKEARFHEGEAAAYRYMTQVFSEMKVV